MSRYLTALLRHLAEAPPAPGRVHHVEIRHDDDCGTWRGHACDCAPEIRTGPAVDRRYGGGEP